MDIMDVPLLEASPQGHQSENWLLDPAGQWRKTGEADWDDLSTFAVRGGPLWLNGQSSTRGQNNRIPVARMAGINDSLRLVHARTVTIHVSRAFGEVHVDGEFVFDGVVYRLNVTDPVVEARYRTRPDGPYDLSECYLTVSIGEVFHGFHYKLIAGVVARHGLP